MTKSSKQFVLVLYTIVIVLEVFQEVQALVFNKDDAVRHTNSNPIVYKRYMRRRPSRFPDDLYMDEIAEVFHLKRRAPPQLLSDEAVDLIIRCDFDPNLEECDRLSKPMSPTKNPQITMRRQLPTTPFEPIMPKRPIATIHTTKSPYVSTTSTIWSILSTTSEELPFLPEITASKEEIAKTVEIIKTTNDTDYNVDLDENGYNSVGENEGEVNDTNEDYDVVEDEKVEDYGDNNDLEEMENA